MEHIYQTTIAMRQTDGSVSHFKLTVDPCELIKHLAPAAKANPSRRASIGYGAAVVHHLRDEKPQS